MNMQSTEKILQDNRRMRMMIDALPTPVLVEDEHRVLVCVNKAFCELFGIAAAPDMLIGVDCAQSAEYSKHLFADPDGFIKGIEKTLVRQTPIYDEVLVMADGRVLERSYTPIILDDIYNGHFWKYTDVTAQTIITHELEASRDRAWEESRFKSEFLAMMSHEIRTPMNGVIGMTELLLTTPLNDTQQDYATVVYEESLALLRILNDILDFSKIEAGKVVLDPVPFSLHELTANIVDVMQYQAKRKGLEFHVVMPTECPVLYGDGGRLRQIIINLLNNAMKFTQKGSVTLHIDAQSTADQRISLHIQVIDTGIGIASGKLKSLFEPFVQGDSATTRKHGGVGLGLAIVKRLADLLEGHIEVSSDVGFGTIFTVEINMPIATVMDKSFAKSAQEVLPLSTVEAISPLLQWILVVEDNPNNRQLMVDYLSMLGFKNLQFVEDGEQAVNAVQTSPEPYALILMDIQMPRMNGLTATRLIRQYEIPLQRHTPIVALTAKAMQQDKDACMDAGMDAVLVKPVQRANLLNVLMTYVHVQMD